MEASQLFNERRLAGMLLILPFILFAIGGTLPIIGEKGNMRIFTLPAREHLLAVAANAGAWRWANVFMGTAAVTLLAGLTMLTTLLDQAGERTLSRLGLVGFLLSTILWVIFSIFRGVVTPAAAAEMSATGAPPPYYETLARWAFALFFVSAVVGFLALASYGASLLQVGLVPAWVGWVTLFVNLIFVIHLLIAGDTLPAFHYLTPLVIGILLLFMG
jgi:hypothetical protein